jgi:hypothetical protein
MEGDGTEGGIVECNLYKTQGTPTGEQQEHVGLTQFTQAYSPSDSFNSPPQLPFFSLKLPPAIAMHPSATLTKNSENINSN